MSDFEFDDIDAEALVNYAITTGSLYDKLCNIAKSFAENDQFWRYGNIVENEVIPGYEREFHCPIVPHRAIIECAAKCLHLHFKKHVSEL